ncbi:MAG: S8 family serine peptidase [Lachnospiraceae bacterium]|nr:S8 family serine peptidase [Lachnospiraceae bacterium]
MRKWWRMMLSVFAAACMLQGTMMAEAATGRIQLETLKKQEVQQSKAKKEVVYAEGEALILYETDTAKSTGFRTGDLGTGIEIEETYTFDIEESADTSKAGSAAKSAMKSKLCVSLVKSDKYTTKQLVKLLSARSDIRIAEPNYRYHILDEDYTGFQWALENIGQNGGTAGVDVSAEEINKLASADKKEKVIALVDTGMDYTHSDLQNVVWNNPLSKNQLKGEHGYDIVNGDADPMDDNGHGTHCSGIMAATANDNEGISGIAQASNVKIMALKVLDEEGSCYEMETVGAYNYIYRAQQLGINVVAVNNSWGGASDETEGEIFAQLVELVGNAGAVSVCAAGNEGLDNDMVDNFPSNIDSPYILAVAASNEKGELADFSNYGKKNVDIAAPGTAILSTVSYDTFNPGIYGTEKRDRLCGTYVDFENLTDEKLVESKTESGMDDALEYKMDLPGDATATVTVTEETYFGKETTGKSLRWDIENAKEDEIYMLMLPYEAQQSDEETHISAMTQLTDTNPLGEGMAAAFYGGSVVFLGEGVLDENGELDEDSMNDIGGAGAGNCWNHITGSIGEKIRKDEQRTVVVQMLAASDGNYTVYVDNVGVSKSGVEASEFGKYDYYNGTSMATPYVTGAVAAIAQAYPEQSAIERRAFILSCSKKMDNLVGKVASDGMLDFSMMKTPRMSITRISLNASKNIEIRGNYLDGAKVTINDKDVLPEKQTKDCITVKGSGMLNKKLHIVISKNGDSYEDILYFSDGKTVTSGEEIYGCLWGSEIVSDGNTLYQIEESGAVYMMQENYFDDGISQYSWDNMIGDGFDGSVFGKEYNTYVNCEYYSETGAVCLNGNIYIVATLNAGFTKKSVLACLNMEHSWQKVADIPDSFADFTNMTLGAYKGKLYLMGGFNEQNETFNNEMWNYDLGKKAWTKDKNLPQGRAFSKALQVKDKMVVTLGCHDNEGSYPANLIFNGNGWVVSKAGTVAALANNIYEYSTQEDEMKEISYFTAHIGMMQDGIIYEGNSADNLGSIYTYQLSKDQYQGTGYMLDTGLIKGKKHSAAVLRDKFYIVVEGTDKEGMDILHTYIIPVASGCVRAKEICKEGGFIDNIDRYWLPCDTMTFTANVMEDYYVETFTAAGKKVAANKEKKYVYTDLAVNHLNGITVELEVKPYVIGIIMEEMIEVPVGDIYMLMPYIMPETIEDPKLEWKSDNPSVVIVDQEGIITVSDKAKAGQIANITVTASDRGTVMAVCKVTVTEQITELPKKNSKKKIGALTYKVTKSDEKGGTVSCVALNNKKLKKVSVPDTVKINGYTFKVTKIGDNAFKSAKKLTTLTIGKNVKVIGKNVCKSCGKLKKITIKSSSIKSIGKNSFKSIHKKAVIRVPKKKKSSYKKMLKKAGCKSTVKSK